MEKYDVVSLLYYLKSKEINSSFETVLSDVIHEISTVIRSSFRKELFI